MKISRALAFALGALALVWGVPASAQQAPITYRLLENASSSGPQVGVRGGNYVLNIGGTFGGTTLTFSEIIDGVSTTLGTYTAASLKCFNLPTGALVQITVSGGSPSGLNALLGNSGSCHALSYADANNLNQVVSPSFPLPTSTSPAARTIVALDVATVTTGGTAVTALTAGHRTAGGFLTNPKGATIDLCINEQATASGTTSAGGLNCISPGQAYILAPSAAAVSVITSDSAHPFSGYGIN